MNKMKSVSVLFFVMLSFSVAWSEHSLYSGQEQREIKALSPEEVNGYLTGHGMGLAKAGELNHYPGPRHVLDSAEDLHMSEDQLSLTREIYDVMHTKAISLGNLIVKKEKILDSLFSSGKIDERQLKKTVNEIAMLQGKLRTAHLNAHLQMKKILTPEQIVKYDELRGYQDNNDSHTYEHHH